MIRLEATKDGNMIAGAWFINLDQAQGRIAEWESRGYRVYADTIPAGPRTRAIESAELVAMNCRSVARNDALSIGEAWNMLEDAADVIDGLLEILCQHP